MKWQSTYALVLANFSFCLSSGPMVQPDCHLFWCVFLDVTQAMTIVLSQCMTIILDRPLLRQNLKLASAKAQPIGISSK